jgi:hypothetical protein
MQTRQMHTGLDQQRHTGVHHERDWRVHPFHRGTRTGGQVGGAMGKLSPDRALVAKRCKLRAYVVPTELRKMLHTSQPIARPMQSLHQFARQTERQIETTHPRTGCVQTFAEVLEG